MHQEIYSNENCKQTEMSKFLNVFYLEFFLHVQNIGNENKSIDQINTTNLNRIENVGIWCNFADKYHGISEM